ncbi:MAG: hypothetical protein GY950_22970 [bacterium]|nr:hypothetical protein [bacterium]
MSSVENKDFDLLGIIDDPGLRFAISRAAQLYKRTRLYDLLLLEAHEEVENENAARTGNKKKRRQDDPYKIRRSQFWESNPENKLVTVFLIILEKIRPDIYFNARPIYESKKPLFRLITIEFILRIIGETIPCEDEEYH